MRPANLSTKIFLDSGDPAETREILNVLGFLDGQTTNPSLVAKSPGAQERLAAGKKFSGDEAYSYYRDVVTEISSLIPQGSVSIEVYADHLTSSFAMFQQGKEFSKWIPNGHIKYPTTSVGLEAAEQSVKEGMRVNMTLVFDQEQAAAVYAATSGAPRGSVFVSPFIGRLDDVGENGTDLVVNIQQMYAKQGDGHVEVLAASVRSMDHFLYCLNNKIDIVTAPFRLLKDWAESGMPVPTETFYYNPRSLKIIAYQDWDLAEDWRGFNVEHELTEKGIDKFAADWNSLIANA